MSRCFVVVLVVLLNLLSLSLAQQLELHFIDVGQGDAVFIRAPGGQGVLYDGGRRSRVPLEYLLDLGVVQVDLVIASHADADHIAGLSAVVTHYRPRFFMDNGIPHSTQTYANLLEAVADAGSQLLEPTNRRIALGDVVLQIIPPPGNPRFGNNDNSVGVILEYGAFRAALTGDAAARQTAWWHENAPELLVPVQVYKSSHHGSENGDTPFSMARFRPETVVIGVGEGNPSGTRARARWPSTTPLGQPSTGPTDTARSSSGSARTAATPSSPSTSSPSAPSASSASLPPPPTSHCCSSAVSAPPKPPPASRSSASATRHKARP